MRIGAVAAAILLGFAALGQAAPLDSKMVAGDAKWVAHVDVDAMRTSIVVKKAYQHLLDNSPAAKVAAPMLEASRSLIGMDPRTDLHGLTLYGSQIGKHEGVVIVLADADRNLLTEKVKQAKGYESCKHGDHELHSWIHNDRRGKRPVTGAFHGENAMVFSGSVDEVKAALDVLDGKTPSLTCKVLAAKVPEGATVVARVADIAKAVAESDCPSKLARRIESICIALGEKDGRSFFQAQVATNCPECAKQMGEVAEGLRAVGLLHAVECPKDKQLVENIKIKVAGKTLTVENDAPAEAVWQHIQANAKKMIEHHRKMHKMHRWHK